MTKTRAIIIGVIACLCFSVGEGLRLTPFPVAAISAAISVDEAVPSQHFNASCESAKYGPVYVPTRVQKSNKRQAEDGVYLLSKNSNELTANHISVCGPGEPHRIAATHFNSSPSDRAPPSSS